MPDYFALLNEPRRPWLDPEILRQKFLALSAAVHPDRVHWLGESERATAQEKYVALNAAFNCLRQPKERLRHLLELELEGDAVQGLSERIPGDLMDRSLKIGRACGDADRFLANRQATDSPLLKVRQFEQSQEQIGKLQALMQQFAAWEADLTNKLREVDARWNEAKAGPGTPDRAALLRCMEDLYRLFSFLGRWQSQLQERLTALSF